jgi:hypothetical protein
VFGRTCLLIVMVAPLVGCGRAKPVADPVATGQSSRPSRWMQRYDSMLQLPKADQKPGTAVVLIVDTSGSMKVKVGDGSGGKKPKHEIASDVMRQVVDTTNAYLEKNPVVHMEFGILSFSSRVNECLKIGKFNLNTAAEGISRVPPPNGGTAIGRAMADGFKALYSTGCVRKYLVCVTDGENTSGPDPARIAQALFEKTQGDVEIHFVAFDVSSSKFRFLDNVNGFVAEAADGKQLSERLTEIYEKRILAEAMAESE